MRRRLLPVIIVFGVVLVACAAEDVPIDSTIEPVAAESTTDPVDEPANDHADEAEEHEFWFGEPVEAAGEARVIEIDAKDDFSFVPNEISVAVGETVTFRVTNVGQIPHDFTIGDAEIQDDHEGEMSSGEMHEAGDPNAMLLQPGESGDLTWTFTAPGEILLGCHVPGHYTAGMKADLTIES